MNFETALAWLKAGEHVTRSGWNGKGMWVAIQRPDAHSKMRLPYLYMKTANGEMAVWLASPADILAEDWNLVQEAT